MHSRLILPLALALLGAGGARAQYDDEDGGGSAVIIQQREFSMANELTLASGALPLDACKKGLAVSGRYTLHFDDLHVWEIIGATYSFNIDSGLSAILGNKFGVEAEILPQLVVVADTSYVIKALYGKFALMNRLVISQELFLSAGLAVSYGSDDSFRPGPELGAVLRAYVFDWLSLRFAPRHALVMNGVRYLDAKAQVEGILQLLAGVSFKVWG